jgi:hypothetical protein
MPIMKSNPSPRRASLGSWGLGPPAACFLGPFSRVCSWRRGPLLLLQGDASISGAAGSTCTARETGLLARQFALSYAREVAGLVLVDSAHEAQRVPIQGRAVRLRDSARSRKIPKPGLGRRARRPRPVA